MANTVRITVTAEDKATKVLKGIGKSAGDSLKKASQVGALALGGIGVAAAGAAFKGVAAFAGFQKQMNEVFTLVPGMSATAMGEMSDQVKEFSKEFGVLPDEVIPSLYSAISAGVPADNVFSFLETAQKAASGGVTDLSTAVDGISSVVNAFGEETVNAAQTSDLMFTAVRLGKTDFEALSKSLFNVTPTAASLGVSFADVTAALAVMTAQGVPTSVATTQLRAAMVEASKGGGKLDEALRDLTGKGFSGLISEGKNTGQIFDDLRASMPEQQFRDLFGSVEGLNAVLAITGPNAEGFQGALDEMGTSAGATQTAFEQMQTGIGPVVDKLKANLAVLFIEIGEKLAPVVEKLMNLVLSQGVPALQKLAAAIRDELVPAFEPFAKAVVVIGKELAEKLQPEIVKVVDLIKNNKEAAFGALAAVLGLAVIGLVAFTAAWVAAALPIIAVVAAVAAVGAGVVLLIQNWDNLMDRFPQVQAAMDSFRTWVDAQLVPAIQNIGKAAEAAAVFFVKNFNTIRSVVQPIIDQLISHIKLIATTLRDTVQLVIAIVNGDWNQAWEEVKDILTNFLAFFQETMDHIVAFLRAVIPLLLEGGKLAMQGLWDGMQATWASIILPGLKATPGLIVDALSGLAFLMFTLAGDGMSKFWDGLKLIWTRDIWPWITGIPGAIGEALTGVAGAVGSGIKAAAVGAINSVIGAINDALKFTIEVGGAFGTPSFTIPVDAPDIRPISLARGGMTTGPTLALIGDNPGGREAVIPLDSAGGSGLLGPSSVDVTLEMDADVIARKVVQVIQGAGGTITGLEPL